ncbi:MAG TPA: hypothetical protein PL105_19090 [Caldilineaceae bacterium]|nr:hypothetical protein [Caldilineaceae bacterium]
MKPTGTDIPTRFSGFPIAATAADTEWIRRADWPVSALRPDQPVARENIFGMLAGIAARLEELVG